MKIALREADLDAGDVRHINAHATSTPQGDVAEAGAIRAALGDAADGAVVTSTKSMTGHLLGAAGALESVATVLALHDRTVPPTINLDDPEDVGLDLADKQRDLPAGDVAALNNSFGFGGHNVALAFRSVVMAATTAPAAPAAPPSRSCRATRTRATRSTGWRRCSTTAPWS